jgi:hypothetical protein
MRGPAGAHDGTGDERCSDRGRQQPEREDGHVVPHLQVGAVVGVERGEHDDVGGAHAGDVPGVAGPVAAAVLALRATVT